MNSSCASKQKLQTKLQPFQDILESDAADGADVGHGWLLQSPLHFISAKDGALAAAL